MKSRAFDTRALTGHWTRQERELACRAVAIADNACAELLRAHCRPSSHLVGIEDCLRPVGADGKRVARVDQAEPAVREAFGYLYDRGRVRIVTDDEGDQIIVLTKGD